MQRWEERRPRLTRDIFFLLIGGTVVGWNGVVETLRRRSLVAWSYQSQDDVVGRGDGDLPEFLGSDDEGVTAPEGTLDEDDFVGEFLPDKMVRGEGGADDVEV